MTIPFPSSRVSASRFKSAPNSSPDTFGSSFDLINALDTDKDKYVSARSEDQKSLSIIDYPLICRVNIDRLRAATKTHPGIHPTLTACIYHGVIKIRDTPGIKILLRLKSRFDCAPESLNPVISATIAKFLCEFSVDIPNGKRRQNVNMPSNLHAQLSKLSRELGIQSQSLAVLSTIHMLSEQETTNIGDRREMISYMEKFWESVEIRGRGAKALMETFEVPLGPLVTKGIL